MSNTPDATSPRMRLELDRGWVKSAAGSGLPVVAPLVSLAAFLVGAGGGGILARRIADRHVEHVARALGLEVSLIAIAAVVAVAIDVRPGALSGDVVIALLALAMGVRNATVRRLTVPDLTTTVLTMTLTGLAAESRPAGGSGKGSPQRTAAVVAMLAGAVVGALLLKTSMVLPLAAAAGLALVTWMTYLPAARHHRPVPPTRS